MKIGGLQLDISWEDPEANFASAKKLVGEAADAGCDFLVLPELFSTGVSLEPERFMQGLDGEVVTEVRSWAVDNRVHILGSFVEEGDGRPYNTSFLAAPDGSVLGTYRKRRLFSYGGEDIAYSSGGEGFVADVLDFRVGFFTCFDLRFGGLFEKAYVEGADLFVVAANWPNPRLNHWETLLKARAIENQGYVLGVNQVGANPRNTFFGNTMVVDPHGEVVERLSDEEGVLAAQIKSEDVADYRRKFNIRG